MIDDSELLALFDAAIADAPTSEKMAAAEARALRVIYDRAVADAAEACTRQTQLAAYVGARPSDFAKAVMSCAAAVSALSSTGGIVPPHITDRIPGHEDDQP
jgi:hypothetical protein